MPATADGRRIWTSFAWRPAGIVYLLILLAGLAAGLWPTYIYPPLAPIQPAPLPALQCLAIAQLVGFMIIMPLAWMRRGETDAGVRVLPGMLVESIVWLIVALPLYAVAGYLADATASDVVRTLLTILALWPIGLAASMWMHGSRFANLVLLKLLLILLGLPCAWYIARELTPASSDWLWNLWPIGLVWNNAASRQDMICPMPIWSLLLWPSTSLIAMAVFAKTPRNAREQHQRPIA